MLLGMRLKLRRAGKESTRSISRLKIELASGDMLLKMVATNNTFKAQRAGSTLTNHFRTPHGTKPAIAI